MNLIDPVPGAPPLWALSDAERAEILGTKPAARPSGDSVREPHWTRIIVWTLVLLYVVHCIHYGIG